MVEGNIILIFTDSCKLDNCMLCKACQTLEDMRIFHSAVMEHRNQNRQTLVRIFPEPPLTQDTARRKLASMDTSLNRDSYKMQLWYMKKCLADLDWCGK